eukprot:c19525_g2_i3 orf=242-538(+)
METGGVTGAGTRITPLGPSATAASNPGSLSTPERPRTPSGCRASVTGFVLVLFFPPVSLFGVFKCWSFHFFVLLLSVDVPAHCLHHTRESAGKRERER